MPMTFGFASHFIGINTDSIKMSYSQFFHCFVLHSRDLTYLHAPTKFSSSTNDSYRILSKQTRERFNYGNMNERFSTHSE